MGKETPWRRGVSMRIKFLYYGAFYTYANPIKNRLYAKNMVKIACFIHQIRMSSAKNNLTPMTKMRLLFILLTIEVMKTFF